MLKTFVFVGNTKIGNELVPNLLEAGFKAAEGLESADVIFTFTSFLDDTEEVYFGSEGMIASAKAGAYLVNLSPATPSLTHEIYALAQVSNMYAVDAPLFVHDAGREHAFADKANLSIFVGGTEGNLAQVKPMLDALAEDVVACGDAGRGQLAKAAASLQRCASVVGLIEADSLLRVAESDEVAATLVARSLAAGVNSAELANYYAAVVGRSMESSYSADIMLGEIVAALSAADDMQLILPQAESAEYLLQLLCTIGGVEKSTAALALMYADEAECARYGLDWTRAETAFDSFDEDECDHDHDHDHDHGHHHKQDHEHRHFGEEDMFGLN
ncbi:MAG: NAD(P)-dependent oxidoreductase [Eggerthellaceae bacterium]|nr:NAD(P)-dependent oxidoreductase [Eggerthellaceae bacterium]